LGTAALQKNCKLENLVKSLDASGSLATKEGNLVVAFPERCFLSQAAIAFLCAWGMRFRAAGRRIHLRGDEDAIRYLARLDLLRHLEMEDIQMNRQEESGRFMPLRLIESSEDVYAACNAVCDLVLCQFENAHDFIPALEWAVNEIVDNVLIHSQTQTPGVVCAQYFPQKHRLDVAICDVGCGIRTSLGGAHPVQSSGEAISVAIQRGVTRDPAIGQGNGMAGALEITRHGRGMFGVWTGDMSYAVKGDSNGSFREIAAIPGTGVVLSLDTRYPVDLEDTWIASGHGRDWSYINVVAEQVSEEGGIDVHKECLNTGTRPPGTRLRNRVRALLPEVDTPLVLNFTDVTSASSSFLDELLGRLAEEYGPAVLDQEIQILGMNDSVRAIAEVVVRQRIEGL